MHLENSSTITHFFKSKLSSDCLVPREFKKKFERSPKRSSKRKPVENEAKLFRSPDANLAAPANLAFDSLHYFSAYLLQTASEFFFEHLKRSSLQRDLVELFS